MGLMTGQCPPSPGAPGAGERACPPGGHCGLPVPKPLSKAVTGCRYVGMLSVLMQCCHRKAVSRSQPGPCISLLSRNNQNTAVPATESAGALRRAELLRSLLSTRPWFQT